MDYANLEQRQTSRLPLLETLTILLNLCMAAASAPIIAFLWRWHPFPAAPPNVPTPLLHALVTLPSMDTNDFAFMSNVTKPTRFGKEASKSGLRVSNRRGVAQAKHRRSGSANGNHLHLCRADFLAQVSRNSSKYQEWITRRVPMRDSPLQGYCAQLVPSVPQHARFSWNACERKARKKPKSPIAQPFELVMPHAPGHPSVGVSCPHAGDLVEHEVLRYNARTARVLLSIDIMGTSTKMLPRASPVCAPASA